LNRQWFRFIVFGYGVTPHIAGGVDGAVRVQRRQIGREQYIEPICSTRE
jgi:hypothetical protein